MVIYLFVSMTVTPVRNVFNVLVKFSGNWKNASGADNTILSYIGGWILQVWCELPEVER